jgi:hypothetical protein
MRRINHFSGGSMQTAVYLDPPAVDARLADLGLSVEILQEAIKFGQLHWSSCTNHDPLCLPGIMAWGKTIQRLRDLLVPHGWSAINERNLPLIVDPSKKIAIAVATGNDGTGVASLAVWTKYPKGTATATFVEKNWKQLSLFDLGEKVTTIKRRDSDCMTWVLLISRNEDEVRCELSLPTSFDYSGHVGTPVERIILEPINIDGDRVEIPGADGRDDIDIQISKRG